MAPTRRTLIATLLVGLATTAAYAQEAPANPPEENRIAAISKRLAPALVKVYGAGGFRGIPAYGAGVVVHESGLILTAWSVSLSTPEIKIVDHLGHTYPCILHRRAPNLGAALLRTTKPVKLTAIALGDSDKVRAGQAVISFGNAFDAAMGEEPLGVCEGIISAIAPLDARRGVLSRRIEGLVFLTDAANNPGTQGGALVDLKGNFIGLNGRVVESRSTNTTLNFSVPTNRLRALIADAIKEPTPQPTPSKDPEDEDPASAEPTKEPLTAPPKRPRVTLGFRLLALYFNRPPPAYVDEILPDSPAAKAGLQIDDLIFQMNGTTLRSTEDFEERLLELEPGRAVQLSVKRASKIIRLELIPAALPEKTAPNPSKKEGQ